MTKVKVKARAHKNQKGDEKAKAKIQFLKIKRMQHYQKIFMNKIIVFFKKCFHEKKELKDKIGSCFLSWTFSNEFTIHN